MSFKDISEDQHEAFRSALAAGQYNLLLGAGASMDASNKLGPIPSGDVFKEDLCRATGASTKHSLQRVFSLLKGKQVDDLVTARFVGCKPGRTANLISHFLWKRIFTWNIDDVLQNYYEKNKTKQHLKTIHYKDEFSEASGLNELMSIHLHGTVLHPDKGYIFSREHYIQQMHSVNPWMSVLATFMRSEPMIISGTSLDEPDLDHYLSFRSDLTSRTDRGPSILVTREDDAITADLCERHNLLHFIGWTSDFLDYCVQLLPYPPTPEELAPAELRDLIPKEVGRAATIAFNSDFQLVPGSAAPAKNSRFQYGHAPTWQDFAARLDVPRAAVPNLIGKIEKLLSNPQAPVKLVLLTGVAGSGKTTIVRRAAFELAGRGVRVFECSALSRIDRSTADVLNAIEGPTVVLIDNFADQAAAISETMGRLSRLDVVFLAAERSYRLSYLETVMAEANVEIVRAPAVSQADAERLIDKYFEAGNLGDHNIVRQKTYYSQKLVKDPVAIGCCRVLNDFKPLARIIDDVMGDASAPELERYVTVSIAQHCFMGGLRYEILLGAAGRAGIRKQFGSDNPLPLAYADGENEFVVPENSTLSEKILERAQHELGSLLLRMFVSLANEIQPFVSRSTIKRRLPEARLAGRLFDYDDVAGKFLGDRAEQFYDATRERWKWNSRYWEQVALLKLAKYHYNPEQDDAEHHLEQAVQHARHAVAIEFHPFGLTTLGKILMTQMQIPGQDMSGSFNEAFDRLTTAINKEALWSRRAIQPFLALFRGVDRYLEKGGVLEREQHETLRSLLTTATHRFAKESELLEAVAAIRAQTGL